MILRQKCSKHLVKSDNLYGNTSSTAVFPITVGRFLNGEVRVRVRGSEEGGVRVRILELSSTTGEYSV